MSDIRRLSRHDAAIWDELISAVVRLDHVISGSSGSRNRRRVRRQRRDWPEMWAAVDELTLLLGQDRP